jgi:hypothetical protein
LRLRGSDIKRGVQSMLSVLEGATAMDLSRSLLGYDGALLMGAICTSWLLLMSPTAGLGTRVCLRW